MGKVSDIERRSNGEVVFAVKLPGRLRWNRWAAILLPPHGDPYVKVGRTAQEALGRVKLHRSTWLEDGL